MGQDSNIEWAHHTFNPWMGCTKVSAGCANCYAENLMDTRYGKVQWGDNGTRVIKKDWSEPRKWNRAAEKAGERHRVFCASLADVFEDRSELIRPRTRLFELIESTLELDWLLLTKRPQNVLRMMPPLPPNVWLGTSIENQATADERIPHLLRVPAAVRFLSVEPLLGPVDLDAIPWGGMKVSALQGWDSAEHGIHWAIVGGESGPKARPCNIAWIRSIVEQCKGASVPVFVKQLGAMPYGGVIDEWPNGKSLHGVMILKDPKGGDMTEWPEDLRVRELPGKQVSA